MDAIYISIIAYTLVQTAYYYYVPGLTLDDGLKTKDDLETVEGDPQLSRMGGAFLANLLIQLIIGFSYVSGKCSGALGQNILKTIWFIVMPWVALLIPVAVVIRLYPELVQIFANVIGYAVVSGRADTLLVQTLKTPEALQTNSVSGQTNSVSGQTNSVSVALLKVLSNQSVIINLMTPTTFDKVWAMLKPLMRDESEWPKDAERTLRALVATKQHVGEAMWYFYTAVLTTTIVYYYLGSTSCDDTD